MSPGLFTLYRPCICRTRSSESLSTLSDECFSRTAKSSAAKSPEYSGLLAALDFAVREKHSSLKVLSDSELLVRQMQGRYKVKSPGLIDLYDRARALVRKLEHF